MDEIPDVTECVEGWFSKPLIIQHAVQRSLESTG